MSLPCQAVLRRLEKSLEEYVHHGVELLFNFLPGDPRLSGHLHVVFELGLRPASSELCDTAVLEGNGDHRGRLGGWKSGLEVGLGIIVTGFTQIPDPGHLVASHILEVLPSVPHTVDNLGNDSRIVAEEVAIVADEFTVSRVKVLEVLGDTSSLR